MSWAHSHCHWQQNRWQLSCSERVLCNECCMLVSHFLLLWLCLSFRLCCIVIEWSSVNFLCQNILAKWFFRSCVCRMSNKIKTTKNWPIVISYLILRVSMQFIPCFYRSSKNSLIVSFNFSIIPFLFTFHSEFHSVLHYICWYINYKLYAVVMIYLYYSNWI